MAQGPAKVATGVGTGTVTSVAVVTANGVSGSVATATTTPAITLSLGAVTPSSVAATGNVTGSNLSGTNTGDQTLSGLGGVPTGAATSSGLTMATDRLLGRTTASAGAIEEISVGTGLSMAAGVLTAVGREVLTAARTYYARADGNDSNTGMADTAGGAFLTIQKGIDVASAIDSSIYNVTVQIADGTWTLATAILLKTTVGSGLYTLRGNPTTPANVLLTRSSVGHIIDDTCSFPWILDGVKLSSTAGSASDLIRCLNAAVLYIHNVEFGATSRYQIQVNTGALVFIDGSVTISGSAVCFVVAQATGMVQFSSTPTITLTGTPAFSGSFIYINTGGFCYAYATYVGSATGKRFDVLMNGTLTTGVGLTGIPGNSAGTTSLGGQAI